MRTLRHAQLAAGGISDLAAKLNVSVFELTRWIQGEERPPEEIYQSALRIAGAEDES
jgi:DNA-binding transcriptional regulator YiaG